MKGTVVEIEALKGVATTRTDRLPEGDGVAQNDADLTKWTDMLEMAAQFASGDEAMLDLIEDVSAETTKGVAGGPVYNIIGIKGRGEDRYASVPFKGGEYAEVYIEGKGTSDLNLFVFDDKNRLVCSDTDKSDIAYCGWRPARDGLVKMWAPAFSLL